jgi:hypothetical protein
VSRLSMLLSNARFYMSKSSPYVYQLQCMFRECLPNLIYKTSERACFSSISLIYAAMELKSYLFIKNYYEYRLIFLLTKKKLPKNVVNSTEIMKLPVYYIKLTRPTSTHSCWPALTTLPVKSRTDTAWSIPCCSVTKWLWLYIAFAR